MAGCLSIGFLAAPAQAQPTTQPASPLPTAQVVHVVQTTRQLGHGNKPLPPIRAEILICRDGRMRIEQAVLPPGDPVKPLSMFVIDGKEQLEYDYDSNSYVRSPAPSGDEGPKPKLVYSYYQTSADWVLHPDHFPVAPGATTTVTRDTLEGRPAVLTTSTAPARKGEDGKTMVNWNKTWVDAETGLTLRQTACYSVDGGPEQEAIRTDFSGWKLDPQLADDAFAFRLPEGAKIHVEPRLLEVGKTVPDFACVTPDGKTLKLSDLRGKVVLIDFWATWCGPCQAEMPNVERTYQKVRDKGVEIVGVCVWDAKGEFDKWVKKNVGAKYNFTFAFDPAGEDAKASIAAKIFGVRGIPTQFVIDRDGKVAAAFSGSYPVDNRAEAAFHNLGVDIPMPEVVTSP